MVGETIESVLQQTYPHWEMLVVDDCSPDDTCAVVAAWSERDPRVRLIRSERNGGPAAARNRGIAAASGRWLAFLDSDDLWLPRKLERCIDHAQATSSPLVFTGFRRISFDGSQTGRYIGVPERIDYRRLLRNTAIATSTVLIDRTKVGTVHMKKTYYDDFACWLEILKPGRVAHGLDEDLMRYRVVANSVSRNKRNSAWQVWQTYRGVEGLSLPLSLWSFAGYSWNGYLKYRRF